MRLFIYIVVPILLSMVIACKKIDPVEKSPFQIQQQARIGILNAFSSTDSAIRAAALNSPIIETIADDRGGSSSGDQIERMRGWNIHLKDSTTVEDRKRLLNFLNGLGSQYDDLNGLKYGQGIPDFQFKYSVTDKTNYIAVKADASFGTR